jgi:hypothetical protein
MNAIAAVPMIERHRIFCSAIRLSSKPGLPSEVEPIGSRISPFACCSGHNKVAEIPPGVVRVSPLPHVFVRLIRIWEFHAVNIPVLSPAPPPEFIPEMTIHPEWLGKCSPIPMLGHTTDIPIVISTRLLFSRIHRFTLRYE